MGKESKDSSGQPTGALAWAYSSESLLFHLHKDCLLCSRSRILQRPEGWTDGSLKNSHYSISQEETNSAVQECYHLQSPGAGPLGGWLRPPTGHSLSSSYEMSPTASMTTNSFLYISQPTPTGQMLAFPRALQKTLSSHST